MFDFNLNGISAASVGVFAIRRPNIPTPKLRTNTITVPGVDGVFVSSDNSYEPIKFEIECNFMSTTPETFDEQARAVRKWLLSSQASQLSFSDDPNWFYLTQIIQPSDIERTSKRIGVLTIAVTCDPYNYRTDGQQEIEIVDKQVLINPTSLQSKPLYKLTGTGQFKISINPIVQPLIYGFYIDVTDSATINTKLLQAYNSSGKIVINNMTLGDFDVLLLRPGNNKFYIGTPSGGKVSVIPNWREI